MKKFVLCLSLCGVLLLTGCGQKTLKCTMSQEQSGMTMKQEAKVDFKGNKASAISIVVTTDLSDEMKSYGDTLVSLLKTQLTEQYKDAKVDVNLDGKNGAYMLVLKQII